MDGECVSPPECTSNADCRGGQVCNDEGKCTNCNNDSDCNNEQECIDGTCKDAGCSDDRDCLNGQTCVENTCIHGQSCDSSRDCSDTCCINNICRVLRHGQGRSGFGAKPQGQEGFGYTNTIDNSYEYDGPQGQGGLDDSDTFDNFYEYGGEDYLSGPPGQRGLDGTDTIDTNSHDYDEEDYHPGPLGQGGLDDKTYEYDEEDYLDGSPGGEPIPKESGGRPRRSVKDVSGNNNTILKNVRVKRQKRQTLICPDDEGCGTSSDCLLAQICRRHKCQYNSCQNHLDCNRGRGQRCRGGNCVKVCRLAYNIFSNH